MKFKSPFNNFDLLTIPISLSYKNKYLYQTIVGSILSIILSLIIIIYFIQQSIQIIRKSSFEIFSNEFQNPKESIDFTNVPILFTLTNDIGIPLQLDPKIAKYSVILNEYITDFDKNGNSNTKHYEKELEIERCDKLIGSMDFSVFKNYNISYFLCIKPFQNIKINGSYGDINGYTSLKINVKKCNKDVDDCYNMDYIDSILSNTRFMVGYLGYKTNFYDLRSKDIEQTIYSRSITLSPQFLKRVFYYMTLVKFSLFDNIFTNSKKETIYYINRDTIIEDEPIKSESYDKDTIAYYSFVYDGNVIEYQKKVEKVIEAISLIGNLFNITLTLFRIINNYFSNKILFIDIFYKFFFTRKFGKSKTFRFDTSNFANIQNKKEIEKKNDKDNENLQKSNKSLNINYNSKIILDDALISNKNLNLLNVPFGRNYTNNFNLNLKKNINLSNSNIEREKIEFIKFSKLYYLCPFCLIKNKKRVSTLSFIESSICSCFSLETFIEFIKIEKAFKKSSKINDIDDPNIIVNSTSSKNLREEINKIFSLK
jgi:hypothetical protein